MFCPLIPSFLVWYLNLGSHQILHTHTYKDNPKIQFFVHKPNFAFKGSLFLEGGSSKQPLPKPTSTSMTSRECHRFHPKNRRFLARGTGESFPKSSRRNGGFLGGKTVKPLPPRSLTAKAPEKLPFHPIGKDRLPTSSWV